jgi:ADP-heptose:LPS heptosyltransferase
VTDIRNCMNRGAKVLIHHDGALGDTLLSLPCFRVIRQGSSLIHIAARSDVAKFLLDAGVADDVSATGNGLYTSLYTGHPDGRTGTFLDRFDAAYIFTAKTESQHVRNIADSVKRTRIIRTIPQEDGNEHAASFRLKQVTGKKDTDSLAYMLDIGPSHRKKARDLLSLWGYDSLTGPLVTIHPGSGGKRKCWPLHSYLSVAERLVHGVKACTVFFAGPAEDDRTKNEIMSFAGRHDGMVRSYEASLIEVAALLNLSDLYIGNDSGITHLAGAVCRNVLALFGPTDPDLWRPVGMNIGVLSSPTVGDIASITVDEVYERARHILSIAVS